MKMERLIERIRARQMNNKRALMRFDQKQSLVYGLCKGEGIDTTGMSPEEAWKALEKKTGISAEEHQKKAASGGQDYQGKEAKRGDFDNRPEWSLLVYNGHLFCHVGDGYFSDVNSGRTYSPDDLTGEKVSFIDDKLKDSSPNGREFNKHKLKKEDLSTLTPKDRIIYKNSAYTYDPKTGELEDVTLNRIKVDDVIGKDVRIFRESEGQQKVASNQPQKNSSKSVGGSGNVEFSGDAYSENRVDKARREYEERSEEDIDKALRGYSGKVWKTLDSKQKRLVKTYSTNSDHFNALARGIRYKDRTFGDDIDEDYDNSYNDINALADVVEKCELPQDTVLFRGINYDGLNGLLGRDAKSILESDPESLIGVIGRDPAFMSTAANNRKNLTSEQKTKFDHVPIRMEIYAPKGTRGMYILPVSQYGDKQNGYSGKLSDNRYEMEMLLQRGTSIRITGVEKVEPLYGEPYYTLKCEVIGQEYDPVGAPTGNEKEIYKKGHY